MQNVAVIRLFEGRLVWYPPGSSQEPRSLDDDVARQALRATLSQRRTRVCFAVPGFDARLLSLPVTAAEKKHINRSLPFMLEEDVAVDIEDLHFAHCALDKDSLAVAVCARERMDTWREMLEEFPGISQWLPEPLLLPWREGEWCLVVEADTLILRCGPCNGFTIERDMLAPVLAALLAEREQPQAVREDARAHTEDGGMGRAALFRLFSEGWAAAAAAARVPRQAPTRRLAGR